MTLRERKDFRIESNGRFLVFFFFLTPSALAADLCRASPHTFIPVFVILLTRKIIRYKAEAGREQKKLILSVVSHEMNWRAALWDLHNVHHRDYMVHPPSGFNLLQWRCGPFPSAYKFYRSEAFSSRFYFRSISSAVLRYLDFLIMNFL